MLREKFTENLNYSQFFSFEVLDYFDSICTDENYEWIVKYFDVLMKEENETAEKFNKHHIRPCCTFKTNSRCKRIETKPLADKFNDNLIKLSIYNHVFAHFYLWKIFNNRDCKEAFQRMCGQRNYINNLTENELIKIATLKEECAKKNQTKEERKEYNKKLYENNKEELSKKRKERYKNNKEKELKRNSDYNKKNKDRLSKQRKEYRDNNKEKILKQEKEYRDNNKERILEISRKWYADNKEKESDKKKKYNAQMCIDPIKEKPCTLCALKARIKRNKKLYNNMIATDYIIKNNNDLS